MVICCQFSTVSTTVELVTPPTTPPEKGNLLAKGGSLDVVWSIAPIVTDGGMEEKYGKGAALALVIASGGPAQLLLPPLLGYISDNTYSKWGSRRPFILFAMTFTCKLVLKKICVAVATINYNYLLDMNRNCLQVLLYLTKCLLGMYHKTIVLDYYYVYQDIKSTEELEAEKKDDERTGEITTSTTAAPSKADATEDQEAVAAKKMKEEEETVTTLLMAYSFEDATKTDVPSHEWQSVK